MTCWTGYETWPVTEGQDLDFVSWTLAAIELMHKVNDELHYYEYGGNAVLFPIRDNHNFSEEIVTLADVETTDPYVYMYLKGMTVEDFVAWKLAADGVQDEFTTKVQLGTVEVVEIHHGTQEYHVHNVEQEIEPHTHEDEEIDIDWELVPARAVLPKGTLLNYGWEGEE